jgi:F0F1-type ATP synthase membrane subunit b/b'
MFGKIAVPYAEALLELANANSSLKEEAETTAKQVKRGILNDGKAETKRLTVLTKGQIRTMENRIRKEISEYVVILALQRVNLQLGVHLQQQIIDKNISKLDINYVW